MDLSPYAALGITYLLPEAIKPGRFAHHLKLQKESAFNEMSYVERRRRDKTFGKMANEILKGKDAKRSRE